MLAASRLTSVPVFPMATPMSACFGAGASFTASPSVKKRSSPITSAATWTARPRGRTRKLQRARWRRQPHLRTGC